MPICEGVKAEKFEARWKIGVMVGIRDRSDELYIMTTDGVVKAKNVKRLAVHERWDLKDLLDKLEGVPWKPAPKKEKGDDDDDDIEVKAAIIETSEPDIIMTDLWSKVEAQALPRRVYIRKADLEKYGTTEDCEGCQAFRTGGKAKAHTEVCRMRIEAAGRKMRRTNAGRRKHRQREKRPLRSI